MWLQRNEKGKFLENPTGTGKTKTKMKATWLAGNANDGENAIQKKSQMRNMEEQLSKSRTGGWALLTGVLGCLAIQPQLTLAEEQVNRKS